MFHGTPLQKMKVTRTELKNYATGSVMKKGSDLAELGVEFLW